ncbi:hypothetical protein MED222_06315 [Vibrio sp. MED222]|nr:hypothetical protein MED222_06315 [Vibrio sp. MED222]
MKLYTVNNRLYWFLPLTLARR